MVASSSRYCSVFAVGGDRPGRCADRQQRCPASGILRATRGHVRRPRVFQALCQQVNSDRIHQNTMLAEDVFDSRTGTVRDEMALCCSKISHQNLVAIRRTLGNHGL